MEKVLAMLMISCLCCCSVRTSGKTLGVCYGREGDNLPRPEEVVQIVKSESIKNIRMYDSNVDVIGAFGNTGIEMIVGIPNRELHGLSECQGKASSWVTNTLLPHYPSTKIVYVSVGEEVTQGPPSLPYFLVPAMRNLHAALKREGLDHRIKVTTSHSLRILSNSYPPSAGAFNPDYYFFIKPMLQFLDDTHSPLLVDVYPYFAYRSSPQYISLDYALFGENDGVTDPNTGLVYSNLFDAQIDAVFSALSALNFDTVDVIVSETGWPSRGNDNETAATPDNAAKYITNLVNHVLNHTGTPLRPYWEIDAFIFALFDENLKPGAESERHFGLFHPNGTQVCDVNVPWSSTTYLAPNVNTQSFHGMAWCVASEYAKAKDLQKALHWLCGLGKANCSAIEPGQSCYRPDNLLYHTSYAFNSYYQRNRHVSGSCSFGGIGRLTFTNPSYGSCVYPTLRDSADNIAGLSSSHFINPGAAFLWFVGGAVVFVLFIS